MANKNDSSNGNGSRVLNNLAKVIMPGVGVILIALFSISTKMSYNAVEAAQDSMTAAQKSIDIAREAEDEALLMNNALAVHMAAQVVSDKYTAKSLEEIKAELAIVREKVQESSIMLESLTKQ